MTAKDLFQSHVFGRILTVLGVLLIALLIFQAGMAIGYRKAAFSSAWNGAYSRGVIDPHSIFAPFTGDQDDRNPHGALGEIVSVHLPSVLIKGPNMPEQVVLVGPDTVIRSPHAAATTSDLRVGSQVIVIGAPDEQGQIHAAFIRMLPPDAAASTTNII